MKNGGQNEWMVSSQVGAHIMCYGSILNVFHVYKFIKLQWNGRLASYTYDFFFVLWVNLHIQIFFFFLWVLVSSTGKVSDGWIRDLRFNFHLHQKLIGVLVWWQRALIRSRRHKLKLSKKKKIHTFWSKKISK